MEENFAVAYRIILYHCWLGKTIGLTPEGVLVSLFIGLSNLDRVLCAESDAGVYIMWTVSQRMKIRAFCDAQSASVSVFNLSALRFLSKPAQKADF